MLSDRGSIPLSSTKSLQVFIICSDFSFITDSHPPHRMSQKGGIFMREIPYDREAAVAYARRWAFDRNPAFYDFEELGGDCTNFASQCVYAGAGIMNYTPVFGWYYRSPSDRTASWTGVEYLYNFLVTNRSFGPYAYTVSPQEAQPGDLVQLGRETGDFYHTPVIVATTPTILVAAHTYDALDRPLYSYDYAVARFLHIGGVRSPY